MVEKTIGKIVQLLKRFELLINLQKDLFYCLLSFGLQDLLFQIVPDQKNDKKDQCNYGEQTKAHIVILNYCLLECKPNELIGGVRFTDNSRILKYVVKAGRVLKVSESSEGLRHLLCRVDQ